MKCLLRNLKNHGLSSVKFLCLIHSNIAGSDFPLSRKNFESGPLNRILNQGAPGTDWQPGLGHTVKYLFQVNDANEVTLWKVNDTTQLPVSTGFYTSGQLQIKVSIDEHGSSTKEYYDKTNKLILREVQHDNEWYETYYIYDDFNLQKYIIQPEGVTQVDENPDQDFLDKWAFQLRYDSRKRLGENTPLV